MSIFQRAKICLLLFFSVSLFSAGGLQAYENSTDFSEVLRDRNGSLLNDDRYVSFNIFSKDGRKKEWNYNEKIRFNRGIFIVTIPDAYFDGGHNLVVTVEKQGEPVIRTQFSLPNEITLPEYLIILLGAVFIMFYCVLKFNTWPKDENREYKLPPRHFTTFKRYFTYAAIYVILTELFFVMIVWAPDLFIMLNRTMGGAQDKSLVESIKNNSVLWSVFLLTGVLPNFPWINRAELVVRKTLHQMAFIPNQAKSAIDEFHKYPECFRADPEVVDKIISENRGQFERYDFLKHDKSIRHKWCKINYLLDRIRGWDLKGRISINDAATMRTSSFLEELAQLKEDVKILYKAIYSSAPGEKISREYKLWLETRVDVSSDIMLNKIYTYISCNILATEKIPQNRLKSYKFFGLYPRDAERVYVDLDTILCSVFFILISILLPCLVSMASQRVLGFQTDVLKSGGDVLIWAVYGVSMHGLTIFFTSMALKYLYNHRFVAVGNRITIRTVSSLTGYATGLAIMSAGGYMRDPSINPFNSHTLLWPVLTAITGCFVAYHIEVARSPGEKKIFRPDLMQGFVSCSAAVLICFLLDNRDIILFNTCVTISFLVGFSIGFIYPLGYRNREKVNFEIQGYGRLFHRFKCSIPVKIRKKDKEVSCSTMDINFRSLKVDIPVDGADNTRLDVVFSPSLKVPGMIVRKTEKNSVIKLLYDDRGVGMNIQALIDQTAAAYA